MTPIYDSSENKINIFYDILNPNSIAKHHIKAVLGLPDNYFGNIKYFSLSLYMKNNKKLDVYYYTLICDMFPEIKYYDKNTFDYYHELGPINPNSYIYGFRMTFYGLYKIYHIKKKLFSL